MTVVCPCGDLHTGYKDMCVHVKITCVAVTVTTHECILMVSAEPGTGPKTNGLYICYCVETFTFQLHWDRAGTHGSDHSPGRPLPDPSLA